MINKQIGFRFSGETLRFNLSQSLFSSFAVDAGTELLLKTLAQRTRLGEWQKAVDVGCGVGVIALCLKKRHPHLDVWALDRDALALVVARENARLNHIRDVCFLGSLGLADPMNGLSSQNWDLIAANIPAKAGVPVLESLIESFSRRHTERGAVAIVTVANLAQMVRQMIGTTGSEVVYSESTRSHTVFHFHRVSGKKAVGEQTFSLRPYIRRNAAFQGPHGDYSLKTVYDLPEFDTLGFRSRIAMELLEGLSRKGPFVIWNPGQGHLPVFLCHGRDAKGRDAPGNGYVLAGRDLLALEVSRLNLLENGVRENNVRVLHTPFLDDLEEAAKLLIYFPDENSSVQWYATLLDSCSRLIERTGQLLVVSRSVHAFRLLQAMSSFTIMMDRKFHGFRGLVLEKA